MSLDLFVATPGDDSSILPIPVFKVLLDEQSDHPFKWLIEYDRESCQLPHMIGFDHLREALSEGTFFLGEEREREPAGAMTGRAIDSEIKKAMQRAKLALSSGDRQTYDLVMVEVVALRKYRGQTVDNRGMVRRLSTPDERDAKAAAAAIRRALSAIREASCPKTATYLRTNIKFDGSSWNFTGEEKWDTGPPTPRVYAKPEYEPDLYVEYHRPSAPSRGVDGKWRVHSFYETATYTELDAAAETLRRKWKAESTKRAFLSSLMRDPWWFPKPKR